MKNSESLKKQISSLSYGGSMFSSLAPKNNIRSLVLTLVLALGILLSTLAFAFATSQPLSVKTEIEKCRNLYSQKNPKAWELAADSTCSNLAFNGSSEAQYYIGMIIKNSSIIIPNREVMAYNFFYVANENGEDRAKEEVKILEKKMNKRELGTAYISIMNDYYSEFKKSNMVKKDDKCASEFLEKSANLGIVKSQDELCVVNALGFYGNFKFKKNYIKAYKWCYIANLNPEIQHNEKSQKVLTKLKSLMTATQIQQAKTLAEEWIKNNPDLINNSDPK